MSRPARRRASQASAALLTAVLACGNDDPPRPTRIATPAVASVAATAAQDAVGVLVADQVADVAPPFAGVLLQVHVRAGDRVAAGQLVAELDPRPLAEELRVAEASRGASAAALQQARVDIDDAQRRLKLETAAAAAGVSAASVVEEAQLAVRRAEAAVQRATATLEADTARLTTARSHVADSRLLAPFAGQVAIRYLDAGAMLSAGHAVVRIVGGAALRLRFAVVPEQAPRVVPGTIVRARIDTVAALVPAVVRQVSPALDPASGLLFVEAELQAGAEVSATLRPGLPAMVQVP